MTVQSLFLGSVRADTNISAHTWAQFHRNKKNTLDLMKSIVVRHKEAVRILQIKETETGTGPSPQKTARRWEAFATFEKNCSESPFFCHQCTREGHCFHQPLPAPRLSIPPLLRTGFIVCIVYRANQHKTSIVYRRVDKKLVVGIYSRQLFNAQRDLRIYRQHTKIHELQ